MKKPLINAIVIIFLLVSFGACEQDDVIEINDKADFEMYIQGEIDAQKMPALSIVIFKNDTILYENYLGKTHIEQDVSLEDDHLFLLASISKVVTATAILQLYDQNLLSLDDAINDYLPFEVLVPNQNTPITFRMLLTHTSGIADGSVLDEQYYYGEDSPVALDYFLENYLVAGGAFYDTTENFHDFEPGTNQAYSNEGSALLAVLVEQISKQDFNTYCKENIFTLLGMTHTFWRLDEAFRADQTIVQPYNYASGDFDAVEHYTFTDYPNGGLRSTGRDMSKLLAAFAQNGSNNNAKILNSSTVKEMITLQIPLLDTEMGLHLFRLNTENNLWGHDGGEEGVATIMAFNPTTKIGAIILTNQGEVDLEEILAETYKLGLKLAN